MTFREQWARRTASTTAAVCPHCQEPVSLAEVLAQHGGTGQWLLANVVSSLIVVGCVCALACAVTWLVVG